MIQFRAHFDGKNLCPDEPVSLPQGVTFEVVVSEATQSREDGSQHSQPATSDSVSLFQEIENKCGLIEGPEDWSAEHDHYLYGALKKSDGSEP